MTKKEILDELVRKICDHISNDKQRVLFIDGSPVLSVSDEHLIERNRLLYNISYNQSLLDYLVLLY